MVGFILLIKYHGVWGSWKKPQAKMGSVETTLEKIRNVNFKYMEPKSYTFSV